MTRVVAPPELPRKDYLLQAVDVLTLKSGLTPWHCRLLAALERIAAYYDGLPPVRGKGD